MSINAASNREIAEGKPSARLERRPLLVRRGNLLVRPARRADLPVVAEMARRLASAVSDPRPDVTSESLTPLLLGPGRWCECYVASLHRRLVGYALVSRSFEAHTGRRELRVADLFVAEAARGSGVGRALFAALLKRATTLGCRVVSWHVWRENGAAYRFYERLGAEHDRDVTSMRLIIQRSDVAASED
jgi:GNAT superfamily N-acetyltransferase